MKYRIFIYLSLFAVLLLSMACGESQVEDSGKLNVLTTTGIIADTVREVGGDLVNVTALMGPGVDPHLYKASAGDISKIDRADIVFYNGLYLEGKMADIFEKLSVRGKIAVAVGEAVSADQLKASESYAGHPDPHIWFDVSLWQLVVEKISSTLQETDPENAATYQQNAAAYSAKLASLHSQCLEQYASIPEEQRLLITAHDAFGYMGRAYNIEVMGLQGINTTSEYGLADVQKLVDIIVERKIKAVFVESSVPRKSIEAVVEGCKAGGHDVSIGGELFSDALGEYGTPEGTYIGMIEHNVTTIVTALK